MNRDPAANAAPLRIQLLGWDNGVGLSRDLALLHEALSAAGHQVTLSKRGRGNWRKIGRWLRARAWALKALLRPGPRHFDLNIMLEHVFAEYLPAAERSAFIPNPEWCLRKDLALLARVDTVMVKTRHAQRIFNERGCRTRYIGFTSPDRFDPAVPRERRFFHLAGRSQNKGTEQLLALWRKHPEWPPLTVVQNKLTATPGPDAPNITHLVGYLSDDELKTLQNAHAFHLCPSETEGYGHYLVEAMSVGAVVLTMDGEPMNELVTPERGVLVPPARTGAQNLAVTYFFGEAEMVAAIEAVLALGDADIARYSQAARQWYEDNAAAFAPRLNAAVMQTD